MRNFLLILLLGCGQDYDVVPKPVDVDPGEVTECGFTRVVDPDSGAGTDFYEYDCNPVFSTTGEDWAGTIRGTTFLVTEVMDHPFYQMWYTGMTQEEADQTDNDIHFGLGYAVSAEGTDWTPYPDNPLLQEPEARDAWDADSLDGMQVLWDNDTSQYVMLYQGYDLGGTTDWGLGVATSDDGRAWKRLPGNPVVNLNVTEAPIVGWCWPLGLSLGEVAGYTGYVAGSQRSGKCEVYRINASDVQHWTPDSDMVLAAGENGEFDDQGFSSLAVASIKNDKYMFYAGFGDWEDHSDEGYRSALHHFVGLATVQDGVWVKLGRVPINTTDNGDVGGIAANTVGGRIHLWVTDTYEIDGVEQQAVGYFLFDPARAAQEDGG
jgi:hypothetical protein